MTIQIKRNPSVTIAQTVTVRDHAFISDVAVAEGGDDAGPSPHDLYDAALGACKALTVLWYAKRKGIAVDGIETAVERDDTDERKGVYRLKTALKISGHFSDDELVLLEAAAGKCPVHKLMATVTTEITTTVERA